MNETIMSIKNRRSIRAYAPGQINDADLHAIVEAGLYAPSASNMQPWHFSVLTDKNIIDELSTQAKVYLKESPIEFYRNLAYNEQFHLFYNAPVVVIVSGDEKAPIAATDCAAATQNMLLAAHSLGLGSCWIGLVMPLLTCDHDGVEWRNRIGIPEGYRPLNVICIGNKDKAKEPTNAPKRKTDCINYV